MSVFERGQDIELDDFGMVDMSEGCKSNTQKLEELEALLDKPYIEGDAFRREVTRIVMGGKT